MSTRRRVVVGLAGHAGTARTLSWAIAESVATGAELVLVHATGARATSRPLVTAGSGPGVAAPSGATSGLGARGSIGVLQTVDRSAAGAVTAAQSRLGESSVRIVVEAATAGDVLLREAGPDDVLVVGGPPRSGWWVRSGTTNHVVPRARCPVIVVHEPCGPDDTATWRAGPDTDELASMLRDQVVVGLDGSGPVQGPLGYGFAHADSHHLPLVVARALPDVEGSHWFDEAWSAPPPAGALGLDLEPWRRRYPRVPVRLLALTGQSPEGSRLDGDVEVSVPARSGPAAPHVVLRRASAQAALLVVGAGGTALHPLGVTCRSLVATAGCPVAVLH